MAAVLKTYRSRDQLALLSPPRCGGRAVLDGIFERARRGDLEGVHPSVVAVPAHVPEDDLLAGLHPTRDIRGGYHGEMVAQVTIRRRAADEALKPAGNHMLFAAWTALSTKYAHYFFRHRPILLNNF
jgi:hypothetical protein